VDIAVSNQYLANSVIRHCISRGDREGLPEADVIQLRAKDLDAGELLLRAQRLRGKFQGTLLINDRIDVCLAAGADGVHLPSHRIAPSVLKDRFGAHLVIGASCHCLDDVLRAETEGADYVYLSPIFESTSKPGYGPALGVAALEAVVAQVKIPVFALGGITRANEALCVEAGAAGIAGISYFDHLG
jgi:thiamine-phosphate pyrophosphorylase